VALARPVDHRAAKTVTYWFDKSEGPTAGTETVDPLAFLARVLVHIPDKCHVTTRYEWLVCQPPSGYAGEGGARHSGWAAGDGVRAEAGADRGRPSMGVLVLPRRAPAGARENLNGPVSPVSERAQCA
jgi:hypothetical protein